VDYKKILTTLIEEIGEAEIGRIIIREGCPGLFGLSHVIYCVTDQGDCPDCWANALGMEEEK
jgi:hypothetical protein